MTAAWRRASPPGGTIHAERSHASCRARAGGDGHGHEGHGDPLARGEEHVELSRGWSRGDLFGQVEQVVRRVAHGRDDDADCVAGALGLASRNGSLMVILSGFDHDGFKNQSLGSLLFEQIARDCIERGERFLDFTIGDEPYKMTFGATPSPMWQISRAGSPLGYAARLVVDRMPAARSLARRLFHGSRDVRTLPASHPVPAAASASEEPATS